MGSLSVKIIRDFGYFTKEMNLVRMMLKRVMTAILVLVCLSALLTAPAAAASSFQDVPASHWAAGYISQASELGILNGQRDGVFGLRQPMTRAAFVTALCRLFGWEMVTPAAGSFTDNQNPTAWYYSAVETACANGAVTQQSDAFRPGDSITREEAAVMLVRALGYGTIAGLTQELPVPFTDLTTNAGYLSMAYELGLFSGTTTSTFSPGQFTTREQAAAVLMRLWDKLHGTEPSLCGIVSSADDLSLAGISAAAVPAAQLVFNGDVQVAAVMSGSKLSSIRAAAAEAGVPLLLDVAGTGATAFRASASQTAERIAAATAEGGWAGVLLDIPQLTDVQKADYTQLVTALRAALPAEELLYVVAEAPSWQGTSYGGYDYAALAAQADRVILRAASYEKLVNGFPTAPLEPLEEVYYALVKAGDAIPASKLSLWLTTTGTGWTGGRSSGAVSADEISQLLSSSATAEYYSARYASAYLVRTVNGTQTTVWFNDTRSAQARHQLLSLFGGGSLCLSELDGPLSADGGVLADLR